MRKIVAVGLLACATFSGSQAQVNYSLTNFRFQQTSFTDISGFGTAITMTDPAAGNSVSPIDIGFSFNFFGTSFSQCMIHADGILRFGTAAPGPATDISVSPANSHAAVFSSTAAGFQNIVMPLFTNLVQGSGIPEFHVLTSGIAPNRVCTIQWKNLRDADNAGGGTQHQFSNMEFQVKLYETSNDIEFVYGTWVASDGSIPVLRRNGAAGIKASTTNFLAMSRTTGSSPFQKTEVLDQPKYARFTGTQQPFTKSNIPVPGMTYRFFGRVANDVSLAKLYIDSVTPAGKQVPGNIEVLVRNEGTAIANNIEVQLQVSGANTHLATVNIASLAAGAEQNVTFPEFDMPNKGSQAISVQVTAPGDERAANNAMSAIQLVSQSHTHVYDFTRYISGVGYNGSAGFMALKMFGHGTRKISQIRIPFTSYRNAVNVRIYEDGGAGGSPSASPVFTSTSFLTTSEQEMVIPIIPAITVEGNYYIAVQQQTTTNMGWGIGLNTPLRLNRLYNNTVGTWAPQVNTTPWQVLAKVYEENSTSDIGVERLVAPGCTYSNSTEVKVSLRNFSNQLIDFGSTPTTITGFVENPEGAQFPFTIQKNSGILAAGAAEEVTVLNNYDFSGRGSHRFTARTNLAGDAEPGNDSLLFFINNSIPITSSASAPVCPLTSVTLTGVTYLASPQWDVEGSISSGTSPRVINPVKNTVVKFRGIDYRGCTLEDSIIVQVTNTGLPPKPILMFGDTVLSHRNAFKDTVRVKKLEGHTIQWLGFTGTPTADSALIINQIAGLQNVKVSAAYVRTSDGCANPGDTLNYKYIAGVLQNENSPLTVCDTAFYDAGGPTGNTGNNFTRTFTPATPGTKMRLTFYRTDLSNFASIQVFDGPNTSSPRIESISNTSNGNTVREFIASNQNGQLTVQYNIGSFASQGWWAGLTCYTPEIYRTVESGNWITASTWEKKIPGGAYGPSSRAPVKGDDSVYVLHNITLSASTPMDQIVIEPTGILNLENPSPNFISIPAYKTTEQPEFLVKGTMNISPRVQLFGGGGQLFVSGRLNNFGQIDLDSVVFNGIAPQVLGNFSGASGSMKLLHINNPAGLTLGSDQVVTGIRFVNGVINTDSENMLTLRAEASEENRGHNGSFVNGPLTVELFSGSGNRFFPIGRSGNYRPVEVNNSGANSENADRIVAEMINSAPPSRTLPPTVSNVSAVRYYKISRSGNSGTDFLVSLPYGADDGVINPNDLTIVKDDGSNAWQDIGGSASGPVPGKVTSTIFFNTFSDFAIAAKTGALPVTWLSFEAQASGKNAQLVWKTANEWKCKSYVIEKSTDGNQFVPVGERKCNNQLASQTYTFVDVNPGSGRFYYRLRQVDADGTSEYSAVRTITIGSNLTVKIFPNPTRDLLQIGNIPANSEVSLFDIAGRLVVQTIKVSGFTQMHVGHLPAGIYKLVVSSPAGDKVNLSVKVVR